MGFNKLFGGYVLADLQSASIEYKHLKCDKRMHVGITNPYTPYGRITNPTEQGQIRPNN